jgi:hypothetical protein
MATVQSDADMLLGRDDAEIMAAALRAQVASGPPAR